MKLHHVLILTLPVLVLGFQNCGHFEGEGGSSAAPSTSQKIVSPAATYVKVEYAPMLEIAATVPVVNLDLVQGTVSVNSASCSLDSARLAQLRDLLANAEVCEPQPPTSGVSCEAIGVADIKLSTASNTDTYLRGVICNYGTFLCGGADAKLRAIIQDLKSNPPAGCSAN